LAIVNGQLKDVNLQVMTDRFPRLAFTPQQLTTAGTGVYPTEPVSVATAAGTGQFSIELLDSETTGVLYDLAIEWQAPGPSGGNGYTRRDFYQGLFVPAAGGSLASLIAKSPGRWLTWVGPTPPPNPQPGNSWLNSITGDYAEWE